MLQWLNYGKKLKPTDELIEISDQSIEVAKELIKEIERLHDSGKTREANRLITIARQMLQNNQKLQEVVGRIQAEAS